MTQKAQIQALINEIDGALAKASPRLPWGISGDTDQQRRVLEQTRSYLLSLQQQMGTAESLVPCTGGEAPSYGMSSHQYDQGQTSVESAQQVLQAVLQEMSYLRANVMQPLRNDVESLQQQREALTQEIRLLEAQRQFVPQQQVNQQQIIADFLQSLMGRLQENLTGQVAQMLTNLEAQALQERSLPGGAEVQSTPVKPYSSYPPPLSSTQRLEELQRLQTQSDQLLLRLDSTLRVIFESLQSNVQSYQDSLGQGLDRMHDLGQQGEAMFTTLVNRLAQQLGREASTYLQSSVQSTDWGSVSPPPLPGTVILTQNLPSSDWAPAQTTPQTSTPPEETLPEETLPEETLPEETLTGEIPSEEISDSQIDQLINELKAADSSTDPATVIQPPDAVVSSQPSDENLDDENLDLDLLNLELENLELETSPELTSSEEAPEERTQFQVDQPLTSFQTLDDDITFFQLDEDLLDEDVTHIQPESETGVDVHSPPAANLEIEDLDSALDLLNQLSAELQASPTETQAEPGVQEVTGGVGAIASESQYDELDGLYESLFGISAEPVDETEGLFPPPIDQHVADASLIVPATEIPATEIPVSSDFPLQADASAPVTGVALTDELFGGLVDPAQSDAISSEMPGTVAQPSAEALFPLDVDTSDFTSDASPRIDSSSPPEDDEATIGLEATPSSPEIEAIAALSDLIEPSDLEVHPDITDPLQPQPQTTPLPHEDSYIPAAPDESLLVPEDSQDETRVNLRLAPDTLQQLTADLSNLEGLEGIGYSSSDTDLSVTNDTDWTFDDWSTEAMTPPLPLLAPAPDLDEAPEAALDPPGLTLSDFGDAPSIPSAEPEPGVSEPDAIAVSTPELSGLTLDDFMDTLSEPSTPSGSEAIAADLPSEAESDANTLEELSTVGDLNELQDLFSTVNTAPPQANLAPRVELTLEDFTAPASTPPSIAAPSAPTIPLEIDPDAPSLPFEFDDSNFTAEDEDAANAFTLEGLDSLFENTPDLEASAPTLPNSPDAPDLENFMPEGAFGDLGQAPDLPIDVDESNLYPPEVNPSDPEDLQKKN